MKLVPLVFALSLVGTFVVLTAPAASACAPIQNCIPQCQYRCPPGCGDNIPCCEGSVLDCVPTCFGSPRVCLEPIQCSPLTCPIVSCVVNADHCVTIECGYLTCPYVLCVENAVQCVTNIWCNPLWCITPVN